MRRAAALAIALGLAVAAGAGAAAPPGAVLGGEGELFVIEQGLFGELMNRPRSPLAENSALVLNMFQELNYRFNQTIIMITHNPEAAAMCKRIVQMRDGHIVEQSPTVRL